MNEAFERGDFLAVVESADVAFDPKEKLLVGISLFKLGRLSDAMKVFLEISDIVSDLAKVFYYMALIHKEKGNLDSARFCLEQYTPFYPDDDEALGILDTGQEEQELVSEPSMELARIYAAQGHFEQALDIYRDMLKDSALDPETKKEAHRVQAMHIIKVLDGWLERVNK